MGPSHCLSPCPAQCSFGLTTTITAEVTAFSVSQGMAGSVDLLAEGRATPAPSGQLPCPNLPPPWFHSPGHAPIHVALLRPILCPSCHAFGGVSFPGAHSEVPLFLGYRVVGGFDTLTAMENVESDPKTDRPKVHAKGDWGNCCPGWARGRRVWRGLLPPTAHSLVSLCC